MSGEAHGEKGSTDMIDIVLGTLAVLGAAEILSFLVLIVINIALFLKLRSSIPQEPVHTPTT